MFKLFKNLKAKQIWFIVLCVVLILGQVYCELTLPEYINNLTILVKTPGTEISKIWKVGLEMLGFALASMALAVVCGYLSAEVAAGFSFNVREKIFGKVTAFGQEEMSRFSVSSLITRTTNDVTQIQTLIAMGLQILIKAPVMAVWAIIKIVGKSWQLSVITGGFIVALLILMVTIVLVVLPRFKKVQKQLDGITRLSRENLNGIRVVHAFNAEAYQNDKFKKANDALTKTQMFNQHSFALLNPSVTLTMNGLSLVIYWVGASLITNASDYVSKLNVYGDILVFGTYATYVIMSIMMLVMIFMFLPQAQVSAGRINEVLETEIDLTEGTEAEGTEKGTVEFKNVSFRYPDAEGDVLSDISFKVGKGETIAFIGATGSGKTTLVSLAARFYDATEGEVLVDGINVKNYAFNPLYNKIGYVTQRAVMFKGSVADNVEFGESLMPDSQENTSKALSLAQAEEFVNKLPEKTAAPIAQGGSNISGGQKQRLSIARALARNPEILIFDDSFSALDYKTDATLRAGLERELKDTTLMIVAQRIGTIRNADKIVVLDNGRAVGTGTHDFLMKNCEVYREIAMSQLSASELE